jgi:hypothetical protein
MDAWERWPVARVELAKVLIQIVGAGELQPAREVPALKYRRMAPQGAAYSLVVHGGLWRSLGCVLSGTVPIDELEPADVDQAALQVWARAYGPLWDTDLTTEMFGPNELEIAGRCRDLAGFWRTPDNAGISRHGGEANAPQSARDAFRFFYSWLNGRNAPGQRTLVRHLLECALAANADATPMRQCRACGHWLIASRVNRFYCDATCRSYAHSGQRGRGRFQDD